MIYGLIYGGIGLSLFLFLCSGIRIIRPIEKGLVETLGKYSKTVEQGFHWIIPVIQKIVIVNITEIRVDVEPQNIITKDKLNATVDAVVYYKIKEANKAIYNVNNFMRSVPSLARTTLRAVVGKMTLADANEKRDEINFQVEHELDKQTDSWGIDIIRVELQKIEPPEDVQHAMNKVVKAENEKIAAKDLATAAETVADGEKRAKIKTAEGMKQSLVLEAEGRAESIEKVAKANAKKIELINKSIRENFKENAIQYKALETTEKALESGTKYVIDSRSNIMNVMSEAAGIPIPVKK